MTQVISEEALKRELVVLFGHMQMIRKELAAIQPGSGQPEDHFATMADLLDAIVEETERASDSIMTAVEEMEDIMGQARGKSKDPEVVALLNKASDRGNSIFEACSFQDLTGQRITKVVRTLQFIEERINSVIRVWGKDELAKVVVDIQEHQDEYKKYLNGPQRAGVAISQEQVDQMFNQDDIDKLFG